MPIYQLKCLKCDHEFEKIQAMNEANVHCPRCNSPTKKLMSAPNFKLKGGGWGVDGYHNPNKR